MFFNHKVDPGTKTRYDEVIEPVENFKYLGSWINDSEHDFKFSKASAWIACNKMRKAWTSKLPHATKIRLFRATVESVLLCGSETWTATKKLEKSVNGCYTRMLRTTLNVNWQQHIINQELYGSLPRVSEAIHATRSKFSWPSQRRNCFKSAALGTPAYSPKSR